MQEEEPYPLRALKFGSVLTVFATLLLFGVARPGWAWGFLIGAVLSLFCLLSLTVIVPMLFRPGASRHARGVFTLTLFMKLPFYALGVYLLTHLPGVSAAAAIGGILVVPIAITWKAAGDFAADCREEREKERVKAAQKAGVSAAKPEPVVPRPRAAHSNLPAHVELAAERG